MLDLGLGRGRVLGSKACRKIENPIGTDSLKMGWGESGFRGASVLFHRALS